MPRTKPTETGLRNLARKPNEDPQTRCSSTYLFPFPPSTPKRLDYIGKVRTSLKGYEPRTTLITSILIQTNKQTKKWWRCWTRNKQFLEQRSELLTPLPTEAPTDWVPVMLSLWFINLYVPRTPIFENGWLRYPTPIQVLTLVPPRRPEFKAKFYLYWGLKTHPSL